MLFQLLDNFILDEAYKWDTDTEAYYRTRLERFVTYLDTIQVTTPDQINAAHIKRFMGTLREFAWSTRNGTYTALGLWFRWLVSEGHLEKDIFRAANLKRPPKKQDEVKPLPLSMVRRLMDAAAGGDDPMSIRDRAIMAMLIYTGVRREEVVTLNLEDLDMEDSIAYIKGKGGKVRRVVMVQRLVAALGLWLDIRPETTTTAVFVSLHPSKKGGMYHRLQPGAVNDILNRWRDVVGIDPKTSVSPHKWRHTYATYLARGGNPFALQKMLGHENLATTMIYVSVSTEEMRRLNETYSPPVDANIEAC